MKKLILFFVFISLFGSNANTLELKTPNQSGNLDANAILVENYSQIEEWIRTPSNHTPLITATHEIVPDKTYHLAVLVTGLKIDSNNSSDVKIGVKVIDAKNNVQYENPDFAKVRRKIISNKGFYLADPTLDVEMTNSDPKGEYRILYEVTDNVSKTHLSKEYNFTLK